MGDDNVMIQNGIGCGCKISWYSWFKDKYNQKCLNLIII